MTELLDRAVATARGLDPVLQDDIARMVLMIAGEPQPPMPPTAEEEASFATSTAQAARGEFATDAEVRAVWAKHGSVKLRFTPQALSELDDTLTYTPSGRRRARAAYRYASRRRSN